MALSPTLAVMERAIEKAARSLLRDFNEIEKLQISVKGPGDFVTRADRRSEELIVESLLRDRPEWGVLGEEGANIKGSDDRYRWIIDPLDGTRNFLHGLPHWAITVALEKDGEIIAGMTLDPVRQEMFRVEKGTGAFMNHTRLRVSGRKDFHVAMLCVDSALTDPVSSQKFQKIVAAFEDEPGMSTRMMGSAALDFAYVAAGRFDAYYLQGGAKPWDVAVGHLLVRESGGLVTDHALKSAHHSMGEALAAGPAMHKKIFEKLKTVGA